MRVKADRHTHNGKIRKNGTVHKRQCLQGTLKRNEHEYKQPMSIIMQKLTMSQNFLLFVKTFFFIYIQLTVSCCVISLQVESSHTFMNG